MQNEGIDGNIISHFQLSQVIANYAGVQLPQLEDILFIDTETTGLAGGTGTIAFQIGLAWFQEDQFRIDQLFLTDMDGEETLLQELAVYLNKFSTLVSFNGKSFDVPLLNSRFILNKLADPLRDLQQIDLLHLSRRIWKNSLPNCSLGTLEKNILNICRDGEKDIPGSEIPDEYFFYLQTRDASEMVKVIYHNYYDMTSMFFLLKRISEILDNSERVEFLEEIFGLAKLFAEQQEHTKAIPLFQKILLIHPGHKPTIKRLSFIYKQENNFSDALKLWKTAAAAEEIYACIELAKFYEHVSNEFDNALRFTREALKYAYNSCYQNDELLASLHHRLERLQKKTANEK